MCAVHINYLISGKATGDKLRKSAEKGSIRKIKNLLKRGVSVDDADVYGNTPLICAIKSNQGSAVTELVEHKADLNRADNLGNTPLIWGASRNLCDIVKYLLDAKACYHARNKNSHRAIDVAKQHGHSEVI